MAQRDLDEFSRIATIAKRASRALSTWPAVRPPNPNTTHVFAVDGWLSAANRDHLVEVTRTGLGRLDNGRVAPYRAFSYRGSRAPYFGWVTCSGVRFHVANLMTALAGVQSYASARYLISAFSLGALVTIPALTLLARTHGVGWVRDRFPAVILLQPPLFGAPAILKGFREHPDILAGAGSPYDTAMPQVVLDLGDPAADYLREVREALIELAGMGIAVTLLTVDGDRVAPYDSEWRPPDKIEHIKLDSSEFPAGLFERHLALRTSPDYLNRVYVRSLPTATWAVVDQ